MYNLDPHETTGQHIAAIMTGGATHADLEELGGVTIMQKSDDLWKIARTETFENNHARNIAIATGIVVAGIAAKLLFNAKRES